MIAIPGSRRGRGSQFCSTPSPSLLPHVRGSSSPVRIRQASLPVRLEAAPSLLLRLADPRLGSSPGALLARSRSQDPGCVCSRARPTLRTAAELPGGGLSVRLHRGAAPSARLLFERRRRGRYQKRLLLRRHLYHFLPLFRPSRGLRGWTGGLTPPPFLHPLPSPLSWVRAQLLSPSLAPSASPEARPPRLRDQNKMPARPELQESTARAPTPFSSTTTALPRARTAEARSSRPRITHAHSATTLVARASEYKPS